jgi:hypothetical protein
MNEYDGCCVLGYGSLYYNFERLKAHFFVEQMLPELKEKRECVVESNLVEFEE